MRRVLLVLAALVLVASAALTAARLLDSRVTLLVAAASFASYAVVGYAVALVLLLGLLRGTRRRAAVATMVVVALAGTVVHAVWWVPAWSAAPAARGAGPAWTVVSANLEYGRGDPVEVVRLVRRERAALLVLQEVTPSAMAALDRAGLGALLPHRAGRPTPGVRGTVVLSRWRLGPVDPDFDLVNGAVQVPVRAPDPFVLLASHASMPLADVTGWREDLGRLQDRVASLDGERVLVVGDLNATTDHAALRDLLAAGVRDAAEQAGSGWAPTWPTRYRRPWLRPVITIDHALVGGGLVATATRTVTVTDSDHRALVVRLRSAPGSGT